MSKEKELLKRIREIFPYLSGTQVREIKLELNGEKIKLKRKIEINFPEMLVEEASSSTASDGNKVVEEEVSFKETKKIKAEIVGTFFFPKKHIPSQGMEIEKGQILGIINCLGIENYIESPFDGIIKEIKVGEGDVVDFGKVLFEIE